MFTTVPMKSAPGLDTPVTEVMHRGLVTLPASATLADAAVAMRDNGVHAVLVEDAAATRLGWVTSRGILHNHARDWTVADSLSAAVTEAPADVAVTATLAEAIDVFVGSGVSHILVTAEDGAVAGVIAESDLVAFLAR
jgi:CBS domain-containing protein